MRIILNGIDFTDSTGNLELISKEITKSTDNNTYNIVRERNNTKLTFAESAYEYLKSLDFCSEVDVLIYDDCTLILEGIIKVYNIEWMPYMKICETVIFDSAWSAYLADRENDKIILNANSTNNEFFNSIAPIDLELFDFTGAYGNPVQFFNILDVINHLVAVISQGKISVSSEYLTENSIAITTKGNIYYNNYEDVGGQVVFRYPEVSLSEVLNELHKKIRMVVWFDGNVMRVEKHNYFDSTNIVFPLSTMPDNAKFEINSAGIITSIEVGGNESSVLSEDTSLNYPFRRIETWIKESYTNCYCGNENRLNLVSEWLISSNDIIGYYTKDTDVVDVFKQIVMIEYDATTNEAIQYEENGIYYLNKNFRNYEVLVNWFGGLPDCVSKIFNDPCASAINSDTIILETSETGTDVQYNNFGLSLNPNCDSFAGFQGDVLIGSKYNDDGNRFFSAVTSSIYVVQWDGDYSFNFKAIATNVLDVNRVIGLTDRYRWYLKAYKAHSISDVFDSSYVNTEIGSELLNLKTVITNFNDPYVYNFDLDITNETLVAGNVIFFTFMIQVQDFAGNWSLRETVLLDNLRLTTDLDAVEFPTFTFVNNIENKFKTTIDIPLEIDEYNKIKANPFGMASFVGQALSIERVEYTHNGLSKATLLTNELPTFC
jgi:hypothetical protein